MNQMVPQKPLENLASREAYDLDETEYRKRVPWITGLMAAGLGGVGFGLFFPWAFIGGMSLLLQTPLSGFTALQSIATGAAFGVAFGLAMAWLFPKKLREGMRSFNDSLYAGDPQLVPPPQSQNEFSARLPCSWLKTANFAVGGVLYLGQGCMTFVPHTKNLLQHREPFEIPQLDTATVSIVETSLNLFARLLITKTPRHMEIKWAGGSARFIVPAVEETAVKVRSVTCIK
jgi:hypothetical protein